MKNCKLFGIIALIAVISLAACSSPAGGGGSGGPPLSYTGTYLLGVIAGYPNSKDLATATGASGITYALASGSTLPAGLSLSSAGMLTGIPKSAVNNAPFSVTASAPGFTSATAAFFITIDLDPGIGIPNTSWYTAGPTSFTIYTPDELAGFAQLVNGGNDFSGKTVTLGADLDLLAYAIPGDGWTPIGDITHFFCGTFDGDGCTIYGLKINKAGGMYMGLFAIVGDTGTPGYVKNLKLANVNIEAPIVVGGIAGIIQMGSITDCSVTGTINATGYAIGSIAGVIGNGTIERCYSTATVTGSASVGGIVGMTFGSDTGKIMNCYSTGNITATGDYAGGIAGAINATGTITKCYALGNVTASDYAGGIVGNNEGSVTDCAALGNGVSVASTSSNLGWVAGASTGGMDTNVACLVSLYRGMGAIEPMSGSTGPTTKHGQSLSKGDLNADGTIGGRFTSGNGWTTLKGALPGFGAFVPMPLKLQ